MTETNPPEKSNYFEWLPVELLGNIIGQFSPSIGYEDCKSWVTAYPNLQNAIVRLITHMDFISGRSFVDSVGRNVYLSDNYCPCSFQQIHEIFPSLQEYRYSCGLRFRHVESVSDNIHITDPRARYLRILSLDERIEDPAVIDLLKLGIQTRIERYGPEFTLLLSGSFSRNHASTREWGFSYHNGALHFEGAYTFFPKARVFFPETDLEFEEDEEPEDITLPLEILKAFAPVIQVIGSDDIRLLNRIFRKHYELVSHVTAIHLSYPYNKEMRADFRFIYDRDCVGLFDQVTEIRFSPQIRGKRFLFDYEVMDQFYQEMVCSTDESYTNVTVMELPISMIHRKYFQEVFPNVSQFQFQEHLNIAYHLEQVERIKADIADTLAHETN